MILDERNAREFTDDFNKMENELSKVIIGQRDIVRNVLAAMISGGNALIEGLPGLGKTRLVRAVSDVMSLKFSRIQFTPDLMPADVTGTDIFIKNNSGESGFTFQQGPLFANILLADEINRATPKTQSALLEAMQEKTVTVGRVTYKLPEPFFVLATQNPLEMEGTYPLPEAQMDRFLLKLDIKFPGKEELSAIIRGTTGNESVSISKLFNGERLKSMGEISREVPISKPVWEYIMDLIMKTHPDSLEAPEITRKYVRYGSSPRGAQAVVSVSRIYALLDNRYNVAYEDVKKAVFPCLRHRLFLNFEAIADGISSDNVIQGII